MTGEVVSWTECVDLPSRLKRMVEIFEEIDSDELLAALPDCAVAQGSHIKALDLLAFVESELLALCDIVSTDWPVAVAASR